MLRSVIIVESAFFQKCPCDHCSADLVRMDSIPGDVGGMIYFFKYDFGGAGWKGSYTLFSTVGGAAQILGMMVLYPLLRKKLSSTGVFRLSLIAALAGYGLLLVFCLTGLSGNLVALLVPGIVVFACNGMLSVLTTLFLSNSVDYGQLKTGRREESVIFSMQTFVVKAPPAGGTAAGTPVQTAAWKRPFLFTSEYVFIVPQNDTV